MKTKSSLIAMLFSFSLFMFLFFACAKEQILPLPGPDKKLAKPANDKLSAAPALDMTLTEALETIEFEARPDWRVAIKSFSCIRSGESLLVHDPNVSDLKFYESRRFLVYWFKNGRPVRGNKVQLDCVCKGDYAALVLSSTSMQGIGIAFYSTKACPLATDLATVVINDVE